MTKRHHAALYSHVFAFLPVISYCPFDLSFVKKVHISANFWTHQTFPNLFPGASRQAVRVHDHRITAAFMSRRSILLANFVFIGW